MAEALREPPAAGRESLGDLVSLAVGDLSQLVRYEVDLAKLELKADARRVGIGAALCGFAAFVGGLLLMVLSFAYAYGLMAVGAPGGLWGAFLFVALTYALLATLAVLIAITRFKGLTGLRKTRSTVSGDLALIRRDDADSVTGSGRAR